MCVERGLDEDGDRIPSENDCDDSDSSIGRRAERPCESSCGSGVERCEDGTWLACDAPTDCDCTGDMTRELSCVRCGTKPQRCEDGTWTDAGECTGQGPCTPGDTETRSDDTCAGAGQQTRTCGTDCTWGEWSCDEGRARLWELGLDAARWTKHPLEPSTPNAPTGEVVAAFGIDAEGVMYVFTRTSYHVLQLSTRTWTESGALESRFPEASGLPTTGAFSVPGSSSPDTATFLTSDRRAAIYEYTSAGGFEYLRTDDPCCSDWTGDSAPSSFSDVTGLWLDLTNEAGWVTASRVCGGPVTAYQGVIAGPTLHIFDAGCFGFVDDMPLSSFEPFTLPEAPDADIVGAVVYQSGLYVFHHTQ